MKIRIANENDFERVHNLMYQLFEKHLLRRPDIFKQADSYTLEQFRESLGNKNELIMLAESEEMVVALFHMHKIVFKDDPTIQDSCVAFIEDFCVDKNYQSQGIGKLLYEEAVKKAKEWQACSVQLNVWEVNEEARKFYDGLGFKPISTKMEFKL